MCWASSRRLRAASTDAKALALQKYGEAALAQEIISRLPDIVRAAAATATDPALGLPA